ncbi:MAG: hypothetical protein A2Z98_14050 [Spirochaetes bacterium GWB1_27_13]|nr:MAG: hypothetical protein A2Z98_14050 [Spirochaetes bacterium GWB1_27_13]
MKDLSTVQELSEEKLKDFFMSESEALDRIAGIASESQSQWFYRFIINFLTSLDFDEDEAKMHYCTILEHKYYLSEKTNRDVGLRVATLDYFLNILKKLKNPKIVEITLFEELLKMGKEDPKTGCFNARFLNEFSVRELKRAERYNQNLSLIIIDIDDFKCLNDKYGHLFGDRILKKFAEILMKNLRNEDIVSRFGGDEFAIILPETGRIGARSLAERLKMKLLEYFQDKEYDGEKVTVTFSAGISTYPFDGTDIETLIKFADNCLYKSKFLGKNRIYDNLEYEYIQNLYIESERRKFTRFKLANGSNVDLGNKDDMVLINSKIIDISASGLLLECNCKISESIIKKNLKLYLKQIGNLDLDDFDIEGHVVRINKQTEKLKFFVAVEFSCLLDQNKWKIIEGNSKLLAIS